MTTKLCPTCGHQLPSAFWRYCSDACKPRCSVDRCENPSRKKGWCGSHYAQSRVTGTDPVPFKYQWSPKGLSCLNCGSETTDSAHRRFCTDNCRVAYRSYGGPRPVSANCVACGIAIDLNAIGKGGQRKNLTVKFCKPCKRDYSKYKMSARELASRDGTDCGICGFPVDMTLSRTDGLECPSVDHILPRSRGGTHDPSNLQLAHLRCNMAKSDRVVPSPAHSAPRRREVIAS